MRSQSRTVILNRRPLIKLIRGDCQDVLRTMKDECIDAVIADPPYGIGYRNKKAKVLQPKMINDNRPFIWWLWDAARVLKTGGALVCFCRWDVQETFRWAIELASLKVRSQWVWDRKVHGMGDCKTTLAPRHDVLWFATKGSFSFPYGRPKSVIESQTIPGSQRVHPTEKPAQLMRILVRSVVRRHGVVLDPCMGSGATGEACRDGYGFLGIEIDVEYFRRAVRRMRAVLRNR